MAKNKIGTVYLVGAGPGDAGLLTLRGRELLSRADLVIYDGLVNSEILKFADRAEKKLIGKVGKKLAPGKQDEIYKTLLRSARQGKTIVRLKGGDPFVFGRGGEEASFLRKNKIPFQFVPGVSAGHAVPAYAGIPVTDRRLSSQVTFVAAYEDAAKAKSVSRWKKLAQLEGTLVLFMGVKTLPGIARELIRYGKPAATRVSMIEWGTLPRQRVLDGTLQSIAARVREANIESPAITVIGEVNRFRKEINWYEKLPLFGKRVLLTRSSIQAQVLRDELTEMGAQVIESPAIQIEPPSDWRPIDAALKYVKSFDWILLTSPNGVRNFFKRAWERGMDARHFSGISLGCVGDGTEAALREFGLRADLLPEIFTTSGLVDALKKKGLISGNHFLLPRTKIAPEFLKKVLLQEGGKVTEVVAYQTVVTQSQSYRKHLLESLCGKKAVDFVTFTSASTVCGVFSHFKPAELRQVKSKLVSIGPMTTKAIRAFGLKPWREAREHSLSGLVQVLRPA